MIRINTIIDSRHFYHGMMTGAEKIVKHSNILNESNGFPVPDRDTGNNLSYLMDYIARNVKQTNNIKEMVTQISNAAISGARGNSGAIFSQFFSGFKNHCPEAENIDIKTLSLCFEEGYQAAYQAISNPMEGTILTAMRSFVEGLKQQNKADDLKNIFENAFNELKKAVESTRYTLKAQMKLQSEDAGAKAFLYFVEGFKEIILSDISRISKKYGFSKEAQLENIEFEHILDEEINFRYCTEILISKKNKNIRKEMEQALLEQGDSMVISENDSLMRVHIHTNHPGKVAEIMNGYGKIMETKADDMKAQQNLSQMHQDEIALVVDTVADLPLKWFPDFVFLMPLNLMVDKVSYQDKRTVFPALLKSKSISSSQPNREQVHAFLKPIVSRYKHVIIITPSAKMSGLYQRYQEFCKDFPDKTTLIDSKLNSVAQGLVVAKAIELLKESQDLNYIQKELASTISRSKIYVSLLHLDAMVSSGRLSERVGWWLEKIGFLPLITINAKGEGKVEGVAFGKKQNEKLFLRKAIKEKDRIENYAIVHANCKTRADQAAKQLTKIIGKPPIYIEPISYIVVNFSGEGSIAIGYTLKKEGRK